MDELDLDAFIANIEETAPEVKFETGTHICEECGTALEGGEDGEYVCPNCAAKATNILQLEETEVNFDEQGRAITGQRVDTAKKTKSKHEVDYGWAWSTDDAVVHILSLQVKALESAGVLPHPLREVVKNLWLKFWLKNIAPYIKDEYKKDDLIPISASRMMKLRDVEVLVRVADKVMIPSRLLKNELSNQAKFNMLGFQFSSNNSNLDNCSSNNLSLEDECGENSLTSSPILSRAYLEEKIRGKSAEVEYFSNTDESIKGEDDELKTDRPKRSRLEKYGQHFRFKTKTLSRDTISILTMNRTLAFIEAAARVTDHGDPLFAADIIRACNQLLIPFYGAHQFLPEGMNLNSRDRLTFQKILPPSPIQLSRATSLLIHNIYQDKAPFALHVPDSKMILKRFIDDMNLPSEFYNTLKDSVDFSLFDATKPVKYVAGKNSVPRLPQYDRWAFVILLYNLKKTFGLGDKNIARQSKAARTKSAETKESYFNLADWLRQMRLRLRLILSYDPFVLYHPIADERHLEPTPQMLRYIEKLLSFRVQSQVRNVPKEAMYDEAFRNELIEFLKREMPKVDRFDLKKKKRDENLEASTNIKYPIQDSLRRTQRFWRDSLATDESLADLVTRDFSQDKILLPDAVDDWCIYDDVPVDCKELRVSYKWPDGFRLLLQVGGFLCMCDPNQLLNEFRIVEEHFYPHTRVIRRLRKLKIRHYI